MGRSRKAQFVAKEWQLRAELALAKCLSWKEFGARIGMSGAHLGIVVRGTPVTRKTAEKVARGFGKEVEALFDDRTPVPQSGRRVAPVQPALPFEASAKPVAVETESAERVA